MMVGKDDSKPLPAFEDPPPSHEGKSMDAILGWTNIITHVGRCAEAVGPPRESLPPDCLEFTPERLTYLKLLLVGSYARNAFLRIAGRRDRRLHYWDVLSASGLTYRDEPDAPPVAGSAFTTPLCDFDFKAFRMRSVRGFDIVHCFDMSHDNLRILQERRDALAEAGFPLPSYETHPGDANELVKKVIDRIQKEDQQHAKLLDRSLSMVFIDNQAMNVAMNTVDAIQEGIRGDLLVYIPVSAAWRNICAYRETGNKPPALDSFFGTRDWDTIESPNQIASMYHQIVQDHTGAEFQEFEPVSVKGVNSEFALAIYARRTSGLRDNMGWMSSIQSLAKACNSVNVPKMDAIINRAVRRQPNIFDF